MIRICFVCLGNICRSPMAEFIMKDKVKKLGLSDKFHIESRATSYEEEGNDMYPLAKEMLDSKNISYVVCGKEKIDLKKAMEILHKEFKVKRLAVVGGPLINSAFLDEGLLDEISVLIGLGIDGRKGMQGVFDGFNMDHPVIKNLKFKEVKSFDDGAVWIRYDMI